MIAPVSANVTAARYRDQMRPWRHEYAVVIQNAVLLALVVFQTGLLALIGTRRRTVKR